MANVDISHGELLSVLRKEGFPVDATVPTEILKELMGGVRVNPNTHTPIRDAAVEMEAFVEEHRHILNIDCDGECTQCADVIVATCYNQLPAVRKEIHEANSEEVL